MILVHKPVTLLNADGEVVREGQSPAFITFDVGHGDWSRYAPRLPIERARKMRDMLAKHLPGVANLSASELVCVNVEQHYRPAIEHAICRWVLEELEKLDVLKTEDGQAKPPRTTPKR